MGGRKLFAPELAERLDALLLASLRQRSLAATAAALETLPRSQQERVLHWVGVAAQSSADLGTALAEEAAAVSADALDEWARAGLAAYDVAGLAAARERWRTHRAAAPGVPLEGVAERLARFIHGLAGAALPLRVGSAAYTDGETLFLPSHAVSEDDYRCMAVLLWCQLRFDSFALPLLDALPPHVPEAEALAWLACLEMLRHEARLAPELPGLVRRLRAWRGELPPTLAAAALDLARPEAGVADSLRWLPQVAVGQPPSAVTRVLLDPQRWRRDPSAQAARQAANVLRGVGGAGPDNAESPPRAGNGAAGADGSAAPVDDDSPASPTDLATGESGGGAEAAGPGAGQSVSAAGPMSEVAPSGEPDALLDEWDYRRGAYRRQWCHVYETDVADGDEAWVAEVRRRHAHLIRRLRRRFEALRGEDCLVRRQLDGEEVDLDALVGAHADRKAGAEPSPRIFTRRQHDDRSLAVMFMIDMSGSTKGWVNDAERESLVLLCEAVEALGDRYAIYGFSGWSRTRCDIFRVKGFAERYGPAVERRIAGIEARDYTRMGFAVRHLSGALAAQPARHRLLITLSDGRPDDYGDEYRGHYGIEDTRRALQEASAQGIRSFCVTIDRHGADYLPRLYGPARYAVIHDVAMLPGKVAEIYRRLTA